MKRLQNAEGMKHLDQVTEELSPKAKHAFETYRIAFTDGDPNMTVAELRNAIARIYGPIVDAELRAHFEARIAAVLPPKQECDDEHHAMMNRGRITQSLPADYLDALVERTRNP